MVNNQHYDSWVCLNMAEKKPLYTENHAINHWNLMHKMCSHKNHRGLEDVPIMTYHD